MTPGDQFLWLGIAQRAKEHGVDHREDGGVGAYAERERHDRNGGEAGILPESADGVANNLLTRAGGKGCNRSRELAAIFQMCVEEVSHGFKHGLAHRPIDAVALKRIELKEVLLAGFF